MPKVNIQDLKRFKHIVTVLSSHGFGILVDKTKSSPLSYSHIPETRVRLALESLGGAFIKLGQMLALRPDLIPPSYCKELEKLQDNTPQISFKEVQTALKKTYSRPIDTIFKTINQTALASGSIAQVHKATLTNNTSVVIKVKKPDVDKLFEEDIHLLTYLAHKIKKHIPIHIVNPEEIISEFKLYTEKELDFSNEATQMEKFSKLNIEMKTPKVYSQLSTKESLVMSFMEGTPLTKKLRQKITNRKTLANTIARSIMKQVFVYGLFHADPHPGNFLIDGKKISLVDFGIVGEVDTKTKVRLTIILYSLVNKDVNTLTKYLLKLNITDEEINKEQFGLDLKHTLGPYYNKRLSNIKLSKLFTEALTVAKKYKIHLPKEYILLGKTIVTTESVCELIDPKFDFIATAKPFLKEHLPAVFSSKYVMQELKGHAIDYADMLQSLPQDIKKILELKQKEEHTVEVAMLNIEKHLHKIEGDFFLGILAILLFILAVITIDFGIPNSLGMSPISILFTVFGSILLTAVIIGMVKSK